MSGNKIHCFVLQSASSAAYKGGTLFCEVCCPAYSRSPDGYGRTLSLDLVTNYPCKRSHFHPYFSTHLSCSCHSMYAHLRAQPDPKVWPRIYLGILGDPSEIVSCPSSAHSMARLHLDLGLVFRPVSLYRNQYDWILDLGVDFKNAKRQAWDLWLWSNLTITMDNLSSRSSSRECQILYILDGHVPSESSTSVAPRPRIIPSTGK